MLLKKMKVTQTYLICEFFKNINQIVDGKENCTEHMQITNGNLYEKCVTNIYIEISTREKYDKYMRANALTCRPPKGEHGLSSLSEN